MPSHAQDPQTRAAYIVLVIGLFLSLVLTAPSISYSVRYYSGSDHLIWHAAFNATLLAAVSLPFLFIYFFARHRPAIVAVTLGAVFSCFHGYLIYTTYRFKPQEFGYLGLILIPFFEILIAAPLSFVIIFAIGRVGRHRGSATLPR